MKKLFFMILLVAVLTVSAFGCEAVKFDPKRDITVVARDSASGTREAFEENVKLLVEKIVQVDGQDVKKKVSMLKDGAEEIESTGAVITKVKTDKQAIGYISVGMVNDSIKTLTVGGVAPTAANIKNGTYAIQRPFVVVYKEETLENALNADFEKFLRSKAAQDEAAKDGYVALEGTVNGKEYGADYIAPTTALSGTIKISGSTSVQPLMVIYAEMYKALNTGVNVIVNAGGSSVGLADAKSDTSDFGMMSKALKPADALYNVDKSLVFTQLAIDGVAIIVNKSNTALTDITVAQIRRIYMKASELPEGETAIVKWSDLI